MTGEKLSPKKNNKKTEGFQVKQETNIKSPIELLHVVSYWSYDIFDSFRHAHYKSPSFSHSHTKVSCSLKTTKMTCNTILTTYQNY